MTEDARLIAAMRRNGIRKPETTLRAARAAKLPLPLACALLVKETGGGRMVYGHDPVKNRAPKGGEVTKKNYLEVYLPDRKAGRGMQGVGDTQLTWWEFQDRADREGGCWSSLVNQRVGFEILKANIAAAKSIERGAARFNGSGPAADRYGKDFVRQHRRFKTALAKNAPVRVVPTPLPRGSIAGTHFTWAEAQRKAGLGSKPARIPDRLRPNAIRHAKNMERLRTALNVERRKHGLGPTGIAINSWYRTPAHNVEVGGASASKHMEALATDITKQEVARICPWEGGARDFDRIADRVFANGGFGQYPAGARHCDSRNGRARWTSH